MDYIVIQLKQPSVFTVTAHNDKYQYSDRYNLPVAKYILRWYSTLGELSDIYLNNGGISLDYYVVSRKHLTSTGFMLLTATQPVYLGCITGCFFDVSAVNLPLFINGYQIQYSGIGAAEFEHDNVSIYLMQFDSYPYEDLQKYCFSSEQYEYLYTRKYFYHGNEITLNPQHSFAYGNYFFLTFTKSYLNEKFTFTKHGQSNYNFISSPDELWKHLIPQEYYIRNEEKLQLIKNYLQIAYLQYRLYYYKLAAILNCIQSYYYFSANLEEELQNCTYEYLSDILCKTLYVLSAPVSSQDIYNYKYLYQQYETLIKKLEKMLLSKSY